MKRIISILLMLVILVTLVGCNTSTQNGVDGKDGTDGKTPYIENGYWYIDGVSTGVKAEGVDGINGTDSKDGTNGKDGINGSDGKDGTDGLTPYIGENGNWWIGTEDIGVKASICEHNYADTWTIEIEATCDTVGVLSNKCSLCGNMKYQFAEKSEHLWSDIHTIDADCLNPKILQMCSVCMQSRISREPLEEKHTYPSVYADGNTCLICGEYQPSEGLEYRLLNNGTYSVCGIGSFSGKTLVIPSEYNGIKVTELDSIYGDNGASIESVYIPETVGTIWNANLFEGWINLRKIYIDEDNESFKDINGNGIYSKDGKILRKLVPAMEGVFVIPECVTTLVGSGVFDSCRVESIIFSDNVKEWDSVSFVNCRALKSIHIGASFSAVIAGTLFREYENGAALCNITVSEQNPYYTSIDGVLFNKDKTIIMCYPMGRTDSEYIIPNSVTSMGIGAFFNAKNLYTVKLPAYIATIGQDAFLSCRNLESIIIPNSVTSIGDSAFEWCLNMKTVVIGSSITKVGYCAFEDTGIEQVFYSGTPAEWNSIDIGEFNDSFQAVTRYYYNEDEPTEAGNYWHYVEGIPTIW